MRNGRAVVPVARAGKLHLAPASRLGSVKGAGLEAEACAVSQHTADWLKRQARHLLPPGGTHAEQCSPATHRASGCGPAGQSLATHALGSSTWKRHKLGLTGHHQGGAEGQLLVFVEEVVGVAADHTGRRKGTLLVEGTRGARLKVDVAVRVEEVVGVASDRVCRNGGEGTHVSMKSMCVCCKLGWLKAPGTQVTKRTFGQQHPPVEHHAAHGLHRAATSPSVPLPHHNSQLSSTSPAGQWYFLTG